MLVAVVRSKRAPEATDESRIELRTRAGIVAAKRDYTSEDGEHGYGVTKAAWTPDSQFFVYSVESSGGHQAWNSPVWFFSRKENKILSLDHALNDAVTSPQFLVSAPDRVTVELYFSKQTRTVALHQLRRRLLRNRLSDNVGGVKYFLGVLTRALRRERHFALVEDVALPYQPKARS